ncbi:MAG: lytic transglycosylase domain-containing protein [Nitrospirae bacterium]|nr:lytic transglycosylase domain-containing protein [Nitrospirota bacterium]
MRLLGVFIFIASLTLPLYASDGRQGNPADSRIVAQEEAGVIESNVNRETVIKAEPDIKPSVSEPAIAAYESNPVAVKAVEKNMSLFTEKIKERFSLWLSRSGKYIELMKEIIKGKNLPENIVFLPLIESGFNPNAYSVARAVGPWQFIASTARRYGLVIDWWRDERKDPVKSTEAASSYLKDLYEMFGSWNLAMAAYNAGEGKILRALNRSKSDDYWSLLGTRHIKRETKEYVPRFIAASTIAINPEEFGFKDIEYHLPLDYDEVTVNKPVDLEVAARCADTTVQVIKELNPELRRWCTPPDMSGYMLRIPAGTKELFLENISGIPDDERFTVETYTVYHTEDSQKCRDYGKGCPCPQFHR